MDIVVLNDGYVKHIESWGGGEAKIAEAGIVEAARQSTQGSFRGWDKDEKLLRFLWANKHSSPFEFAGMTIEVQAPIMVFREWHRHRTQSYNEMSARYSPMPDVNYIPSVERLMMSGGANRQAGAVAGSEELTTEKAETFRRLLGEGYARAEVDYQLALQHGVPKELARLVIPVGRCSRMRATANLRNWLAFLTLRMDPSAQWEIRQYADAVGRVIEQEFPKTWAIFRDTAST